MEFNNQNTWFGISSSLYSAVLQSDRASHHKASPDRSNVSPNSTTVTWWSCGKGRRKVVRSAVRPQVHPSCHSGKRRQTKCRFIYFIFLLERNTQDSSPMTGRHWYTTDRYKVLEKDNRHTPLRAYKEPKVPGGHWADPYRTHRRNTQTPAPPTSNYHHTSHPTIE